MKQPCVYRLASRRNGTLYVGVTANLIRRVSQHRDGITDGFTKKYRIRLLVWFEFYATMADAIAREKSIKEWRRADKLALIEIRNPHWLDLYPGLF
ncbi:MAG: GIY-YIG nuclease family protein [Pseudoxanthomonas sp.]